jgi:hypothetical protein
MSENGSIVNWIIDLQGSPGDLALWATEFSEERQYRVEWRKSDDGMLRYYLHSSKFEGIGDTEIYKIADTVITNLNGIIKILRGGGGQVIRGAPITIREDGSRVPLFQVRSDQMIQNEALARVASGQRSRIDRRSPATEWAALAEEYWDVAASLEFFGKPDNWIDFYKTYEAICKAIGGPRVLYRKQWVNRQMLDDFRRMANSHRHGKGKPLDLITLSEGRELLRTIMRCGLNELGTRRASSAQTSSGKA